MPNQNRGVLEKLGDEILRQVIERRAELGEKEIITGITVSINKPVQGLVTSEAVYFSSKGRGFGTAYLQSHGKDLQGTEYKFNFEKGEFFDYLISRREAIAPHLIDSGQLSKRDSTSFRALRESQGYKFLPRKPDQKL